MTETKATKCDRDGKWKQRVQRWLRGDNKIALLSLGKANLDVSNYVNERREIEIPKIDTRFFEKEKSLGFKVVIR